MKQVINIRLGHYVLTADDDAAALISSYTASLHRRYDGEEGGREIIEDIEERIGELLQNRQNAEKRNFTTVEDAREVLAQMGPVEEGQTQADKSGFQADSEVKKRLFRDPEQQIVGGVCAGLAEYFAVDVVIVRILFLIAFFVFGFGAPVYIIMWAVTPEARTSADRLMMRGQAPTLQNIEDNIRNEVNGVAGRVQRNSSAISAFLRGMVQGMAKVVVFLTRLIIWVVVVAIAMAFIGILVAISTDSATIQLPNFEVHGAAGINELLGIPWGEPLLTKILLIAFTLLSLAGISLFLVSQSRNSRAEVRTVRRYLTWINTILFFAIVTTVIAGFSRLGRPAFHDIARENIAVSGDTLYLNSTAAVGDREGLWLVNELEDVRVSPDSLFHVEARVKTFRSPYKTARQYATEFTKPWTSSNNELTLTEAVKFGPGGSRGLGYSSIIIYVPKGKSIKLRKTFAFESANQTELSGPGSVYTIDSAGRVQTRQHGTVVGSSEDFRKITINGLFDVKIIQSNDNRVELISGPVLSNSDWVSIHDEHLFLESEGHYKTMKRSVVHVYVRDIDLLDISATAKVNFENWSSGGITMKATGASTILGKFKLEHLELELEGAAECVADGSAGLVQADVEGASTLQALNLQCREARVDVEGASNARLWVTQKIDCDVEGASTLQLKGNPPEARLRSTGGSDIERI